MNASKFNQMNAESESVLMNSLETSAVSHVYTWAVHIICVYLCLSVCALGIFDVQFSV